MLAPRPQRPGGPPILVAGRGPRRTLPLVARYADISNAPDFDLALARGRAALLDRQLRAAGRRPEDVRRTLTAIVACGRTPAELERRMRGIRRRPQWGRCRSTSWWRPCARHHIIGTPDEVVAQLRAGAEAGIAELSAQWCDAEDLEGLELLAAEVLPRLDPAAA